MVYRRVIFALLTTIILVAGSVFAGGQVEVSEPSSTADGFTAVTAGEYNLAWKLDGQELEIRMSAPTTGWVAVGFKPSRSMKDADMAIGYVSGGTVTLEDHFGTGLTTHASDVSLGGAGNLTVISGSERDGTTEITFRRPLAASDDYDQPLQVGSEVVVIFAYGRDGADNVSTAHRQRGGFRIEL